MAFIASGMRKAGWVMRACIAVSLRFADAAGHIRRFRFVEEVTKPDGAM